MNPVTIRKANFDRIVAQAEREFPFECCGFILGSDAVEGADAVEEVRPITNIQNLKHAEDPIAFVPQVIGNLTYQCHPIRQTQIIL